MSELPSSVSKHVLITRAEPDASASAERIAALGLTPIVAPIFSVRVRPIGGIPSNILGTVLTSGNAVQSCPGHVHGKPAFAVGPTTAAKAALAGFRHVINADGDAEALSHCVERTLERTGGCLFFPTAPQQGAVLAARLRKAGFRVIRRVGYETIQTPELPELAARSLRAGQIDVALFFSTESAKHFVRLVKAAGLTDATRNVRAVTISERPIVALGALPWRRVSVASKPNQDAMLALLT